MIEGPLERALEFLDSWLPFRERNADICGFKVAIHHREDIVFSRSYGLANAHTREPMASRHLLGIGSQSKMLASTVVCQMVQRGKLGFDDRIGRHLPWISGHSDPRVQNVTVRQLLAHSSGLSRNGDDADCWNFTKPFPKEDEVRDLVFNTAMVVDSNTRLKYSNIGFVILGALIQSIAGQSYVDVVTSNVIERVGMRDTFADFGNGVTDRLARSHTSRIEGRRLGSPTPETAGALVAATGVCSTPEDMCRFASAHYMGCDVLLNESLRKEAQRGQWVVTTGQDCGMEMGLGFHAIIVDGRRYVGHGGSVGGYRSETLFDPYEKLAVSIMTNWADAPSTAMIRGILQVIHYFEEYGADPVPAHLDRFNVRLRNAMATVQIVATGHRLVAIDPEGWEPFTATERLSVVDADTLRVSTVGSVFNEGETFRYVFDGHTAQSVTYAGFSMLPEREYVETVNRSGPQTSIGECERSR